MLGGGGQYGGLGRGVAIWWVGGDTMKGIPIPPQPEGFVRGRGEEYLKVFLGGIPSERNTFREEYLNVGGGGMW